MPLIPFPDIPADPGVPALPRSPLFPPATTIALGLVQSLIWRIFQVETQWGIFDKNGNALGNPAIFTGLVGDALETAGLGSTQSTSAVDYNKEMRVSDFPVERGNFASYNKVELPADPIVTLCLQGTESDRTFFINQIEAATISNNLYSIVTPEITYINYTITSMNYPRRKDRGATLIVIELKLKQVREVSAVYSQATPINMPQNPTSTPQVNGGIVQAQTPPTSVLQSAVTQLPSLSSFLNLVQ